MLDLISIRMVLWRERQEILRRAETPVENARGDEADLATMHPRQVLSRELIYDRIWGYDFGGESNILEVYIRYLRSKLEATGEPRLIQTVRGVGYALRED